MLTKYRQLIYMDNKPTATDPSTVYANARLYWLIQKRGGRGIPDPLLTPSFQKLKRPKVSLKSLFSSCARIFRLLTKKTKDIVSIKIKIIVSSRSAPRHGHVASAQHWNNIRTPSLLFWKDMLSKIHGSYLR